MSNGNKVMKNMKYGMAIAAALVCAMLFTACDNIFNMPETHRPIESGYGRVSISLTGGKSVRTVLPSTIFDRYEYTFTDSSETPVVPEEDGEYFVLEAGYYKVKVEAYLDENKVAEGSSEQFYIAAGESSSIDVFLTNVDTGAQGKFKYTITYPVGAEAEITLQQWPDMNDITLDPDDLIAGNGITEELELEAGSYMLTIHISKNALYAGIVEIIRIYSSIVTEYEKDFDDGALVAVTPITNVEFSVTAPVKDMTPNTTASGTGNFSVGAVSWSPADSPFLGGVAYTATFTLTANHGCSFTGLSSATANINGQSAAVSNNTGATVMLSYTFPTTDTRTATDIAIKTQPDNLTYLRGDPLDLTGLEVTLTFDDTTTEDVTADNFASKNITATPAHGNSLSLAHNAQPVTISYGSLTATTGNLIVNPASFAVDPISAQTYTGSPIRPDVTVKDGTTTLTLNTDYTVAYNDNTNVGTASVTITGIGYYTDNSNNTTFVINPKVMTFTVDPISDQTYTGSPLTPAVTVMDGATILTEDTDYTVGYSNNTYVGTATVTITGAGNYAGSSGSAEFTIIYQSFNFVVDAIPDETYTGSPIEPAVNVYDEDGITELTEDTDYTVVYDNNINAGTNTATVTITGIGSYAGGYNIEYFTINPKVITSFTVDAIPDETYTGSPIEPAVTVRDGETILTRYTDYTVEYNNNITAGTATVAITGIGNYTGSLGAEFTINPITASFVYYWLNEDDALVTTSGGIASLLPGTTLTITAQDEASYDVIRWHLNGTNTGQSGSTYNFTPKTTGTHIVTLFVEKGGKLYSTRISVTVVAGYTVTFDINGGTGTAPASQTGSSDYGITLSDGSGFSKTGYIFDGWNTAADATGTDYNAGDSYTPTVNITFYAKWYELRVASASEWSTALTKIVNSGSGTSGTPKTYDININGDVTVPGSTSTNLGSVEYVEVTLVGSGTLSLSSNGSILNIGSYQKLIIDSEDLTLQGFSSNNRSLVYVDSYGTLELRNGTISGNRYNTTSFSSYAGGVYNSGTFIMSGGKISDNSSYSFYSSSVSAYGGGVYNSGTFTMSGGEISGNTSSATMTYYYNSYSSSAYGGGVYNSGTFTMGGGTISGNTSSSSNYYSSSYANAYGGGVYIYSGSSFDKSGGGIIYGNDGSANSNTAKNSSSGYAVFWNSSSRYRSTTLGESDDISTSVTTSPPWNQ